MKKRRIRVYLSTFSTFGTSVRDGLIRFAATRPHWRLELPQNLREMTPRQLAEVDGYLGGFGSEKLRDQIAASGRPVVDMLHGEEPITVPAVFSDEEAVGRAAAEHLIANGHRRLVFVDLAQPHSAGRGRGFIRAAEEAGAECHEVSWKQTSKVPAWRACLRDLGAPLGVFVADDYIARKLIEICEWARLWVPDQVAVVGANDSLFCPFCDPPLSSVALDWERIGFEAALLLDGILDGTPPPQEPLVIPPLGVAVRPSSDSLAIDDEDVSSAMRWIRDHAAEPVTVGDLLRDVPVDRRSLERKFRRYLGRSPWQEIRRVHIEHVKRLLIDTDWLMPKVAAASGFRDAKHLGEQFRKSTGKTPTDFRQRHRSSR